MIFELTEDFAAALSAIPAEHPKRAQLALLEQAITRDLNFVDVHPTTLFQCLWNTCWWYDCPELAQHYGRRCRRADRTLRDRRNPGMSALLETWLGRKEQATPDFLWLRARLPPAHPLGFVPATCLAFSPDGRELAAGMRDGTVRVWSVRSGEQRLCCRRHDGHVTSVVWAHRGDRLFSAGQDGTVRGWDGSEGNQLYCLHGHRGPVLCLAVSRDDRCIASGAWDRTLRTWDSSTGRALHVLSEHRAEVSRVAFSCAGDHILSFDGWMMHLWDRDSGEQIEQQRKWTESSLLTALSPDGQWALVVEDEEALIAEGLWSMHVHRLAGNDKSRLWCVWRQGRPACGAVWPDCSRVVTGERDGTVRVFESGTRAETACLPAHGGAVHFVAVSPDGRWFASASYCPVTPVDMCGKGADRLLGVPDALGFSVCLWDTKRRRSAASAQMHKSGLLEDRDAVRIDDDFAMWWLVDAEPAEGREPIVPLSYTEDGRCAVSVGWPHGSLTVWDAVDGVMLQHVPVTGQAPTCAALCTEHARLAFVAGGQLRFWDLHRRREVRVPCEKDLRTGITCIACAAHGRLFVTGDHNGAVRLWDCPAGTHAELIGEQKGVIRCVAFSRCARYVVSGDDQGTVHVWDLEQPFDSFPLRGLDAPLLDVAIASNGREVLGTTMNGHSKVWDMVVCRELFSGQIAVWRASPLVDQERQRCVVLTDWELRAKVVDSKTDKPLGWLPVGLFCVRGSPAERAWAAEACTVVQRFWDDPAQERQRRGAGRNRAASSRKEMGEEGAEPTPTWFDGDVGRQVRPYIVSLEGRLPHMKAMGGERPRPAFRDRAVVRAHTRHDAVRVPVEKGWVRRVIARMRR